MKHHHDVRPLIRTLIICAIASLLTGIIAACGGSNGNSSSNSKLISVTITGVTKSNNTVTVAYNLTEPLGYIEHQSDVVTLVCTLSPKSFMNSRVVEGAGPGTIDIQVDNNTNGPSTVTCSVMQNGNVIGGTAEPFSFTLASAPSACTTCSTCSSGNSLPQGGGPQVVLATEDCTPTPTDTPVAQPGAGPYYIFVIAVEPGGSIVVGTQADVQKPSCDFTDGGTCSGNDANVQVLATLGGPYDTMAQAVAAYCSMVTGVHSAFGGNKGYINGQDYWLDNAPSCSS